MKIIPEIDLTAEEHDLISELRNDSFPEHQVPRSYYKQLPHYRCVEYEREVLVGYMGLDYRAVGVGGSNFKVLGVIDFCIKKEHRGAGLGSSMLLSLAEYAERKDVDFIILISDLDELYLKNGYLKMSASHSWLRLNEFKNYGVAHEPIDEFYVKPISGKDWVEGHVDWLGYMY